MALVSFGLQATAIAGLLLFSLLRTEGLPQVQFMSSLVAPTPSGNTVTPRPVHPTVSTLPSVGQISVPTYEPHGIAPEAGSVAPPAIDMGQFGVGRNGPGVPYSVGDGLSVVVPPPPPTVAARPPRVSRMMEGNLTYRVQPTYPALARQVRIQGSVVLRAIISREGVIENLQVLNGHPLLVPAAIDAVRQWRYRPYVLDGEPIEVETQVTVNFTLGGS
jgi:protein TonB